MKILLIRFSSIGDIVLCSPAIRCLKEKFPEAEIYFLTKKKFASLLEFNPNINGVITLDDKLSRTIREIKNHRFDLIADLHNSLRSRWIGILTGLPVYTYSKENFAKWLIKKFQINRFSGRNVAERYFEALKPLNVRPDDKGADFYSCDCEHPDENELPDFIRFGVFAVFSIGGTYGTKKMPSGKWAELGLLLPCPVLLAGGLGDSEEAGKIEKELLHGGKQVFNACGKYSLGGTAYLIEKSSLVISHDTGLMHIAAAYKKPVVCIWGNTIPEFGFEPYKTPHFNLEVKNLGCRPCSRTGYDACPKLHFRCMQNQNLQQPELWQFISKVIEI